MDRRSYVTLLTASVLAGCSQGDPETSPTVSAGDSSTESPPALACVDGDYPAGIPLERIAESLGGEWDWDSLRTTTTPNNLSGYDEVLNIRAFSPDGDEARVAILRYSSTQQAASLSHYRVAVREGPIVITFVGGELLETETARDLLSSFGCVSRDEFVEAGS